MRNKKIYLKAFENFCKEKNINAGMSEVLAREFRALPVDEKTGEIIAGYYLLLGGIAGYSFYEEDVESGEIFPNEYAYKILMDYFEPRDEEYYMTAWAHFLSDESYKEHFFVEELLLGKIFLNDSAFYFDESDIFMRFYHAIKTQGAVNLDEVVSVMQEFKMRDLLGGLRRK